MAINLNGRTKLYPLLGDPIVYARSPEWLSEHFAKRGMNYVSLPMEVPDGALKTVMDGLKQIKNVDGICLTMPHKVTGLALCDTLTETSRLVGVVSAIRRNKDGSWHGHTTDGDAFVKAQMDHGAVVKDARVLVMGAGGAGSAIVIAMLEHGAREVGVYDIDENRSCRLVNLLSPKVGSRIRLATNDPSGFDLVCNATSVGMDNSDPLPLDPSKLSPFMFVGDVVAGHGETKIIKAAKAVGCKTANGDDMVVAVLDVMCDLMEQAWT